MKNEMKMKETKENDNAVILKNNYCFKVINSFYEKDGEITDINELKLLRVFRMNSLVLKIDFNEIPTKRYKKILKKFLLIKKVLNKNKIGIMENSKKLLGYLVNYDKNNKEHNDFISGINAILCNTRYERYNYIYDEVCNYLDSYFNDKNLCEFECNKCPPMKNAKSLVGCCNLPKHKILGPFSKLVPCKYLNKDYKCEAECISCKLFTCDYLVKKQVQFRIKDILLLDVFFRPLQKYYIKCSVFIPKEKIMKKLMRS